MNEDCGTCREFECPDHGQPQNMRTVPEEECAMNALPVAVWDGAFTIGPVRVPCYVLDDGRRVISADGIQALFAYFAGGGEMSAEEARELARFVRAQP
jgi:hypothetical protein